MAELKDHELKAKTARQGEARTTAAHPSTTSSSEGI